MTDIESLRALLRKAETEPLIACGLEIANCINALPALLSELERAKKEAEAGRKLREFFDTCSFSIEIFDMAQKYRDDYDSSVSE